jgi:hypothetical protein
MKLSDFSELGSAHHMTKDRTDTTQNMWPAQYGKKIRTRDSSIERVKTEGTLNRDISKLFIKQLFFYFFPTSLFKKWYTLSATNISTAK